MSADRRASVESPQGGFAFLMVVLLLFAIAVAAATGYQAVKTEFFQSQQSSENGQALAVAQAGLAWFIGGQRGAVADTTEYSINGGTAVITTRKVATLSDAEDLYLVTSEATYTDPRYPQVPAVRSVSQYTIYKKIPMNTMAPLITTSNQLTVEDDADIDAQDYANPGQCSGAPAATLAGVVGRGNPQIRDNTVTGSPVELNLRSYENVVDSTALAWDIYTDPDFPVDFDGSLPGWFWFLFRPDTFPVTRINGDLRNPSRWDHNGRGVLIVTGNLEVDRRNSRWEWDGIVMAGDLSDTGRNDNNNFTINGALVVGIGSQMGRVTLQEGDIRYNSCYVASAGASLAHMEPVANSYWESG